MVFRSGLVRGSVFVFGFRLFLAEVVDGFCVRRKARSGRVLFRVRVALLSFYFVVVRFFYCGSTFY